MSKKSAVELAYEEYKALKRMPVSFPSFEAGFLAGIKSKSKKESVDPVKRPVTVFETVKISNLEPQAIDWSLVPEGTEILVKNEENSSWYPRRFIRMTECGVFLCENWWREQAAVPWKYGRLFNEAA